MGPDGIGAHLLREIAEHEYLGGQLVHLVKHIVTILQLPSSWEKGFLALLAKCDLPQKPKNLRPISVSSAFNKLINRMISSRALPHMRRGSKISPCGRGRQTADLIGSVSHLRDVCREWKEHVILCKLDVVGAFDRVSRDKVADLLCSRVSDCRLGHELKYLLAQLRTHVLVGRVPGGETLEVRPNCGIKQGAPESAELFGLLLDSKLGELASCRSWQLLGRPFEELDLDLLFYQDDVFMVESDFARLCKRIRAVDRCLQKIGLKLATEKTAS